MKPCTFHTYPNGAVRCFHCGEAKPLLPGCWPTQTWMRNRLRYLKVQELREAMAEAKEAKKAGGMQ